MSNQPLAPTTRPAPAQPAKVAKPTQQKLIGLDVVRLKSLQDVSLDFSLNPLTAITEAIVPERQLFFTR